jgi:hypothetical protein
MAVPWLRILDAVIGVTDLARSRRLASASKAAEGGSQLPSGIETRLAGVVVAALREAFDRDARRLELEREQMEEDRRRAERALQLELLRQAADREVVRLRAIAGMAVVIWLGSLFIVLRAASVASRVAVGFGWLLLVGGIAASFSAQASVAESLSRERASTSDAGFIAQWLTIAGFALVALAALL